MKNIFIISFSSIFFLISCVRENPQDRNYLSFPNGNTDEIIDSLYSFQNFVKSMDLPYDKKLRTIWFNYNNNNLEISGEVIGNINFHNLRESNSFKKLSNNDIHEFIKLFRFLFYNNIIPGTYRFASDRMYFEYKKYYFMYNTYNYDDDLDRFLKLANSENELDLAHFKILDSYKDIYLTTFKDSKIWGDSVKYRIDPKFRIE